MHKVDVYKFPTDSPDDVSKLEEHINRGIVNPEKVVAIITKTEGNGRVNDFTRGLSVSAFANLLSERTGWSKQEVTDRVVFVGSGGCEGVMSPHATVFTKEESSTQPARKVKKLTIGNARTRNLEPEEIGTLTQVKEVAEAVRTAMADAEIEDVDDVHYVQVKCPLLDTKAMNIARSKKATLKTEDTVKSLGFSNGSSGLGIALGLGEVKEDQLSEDVICSREDLYTTRGASSAGIEMLKCEVFVLGTSLKAASNFTIGHATMMDFIDVGAVKEALRNAGLNFDCCPSEEQLKRVVQLFAKGQVDIRGQLRGRRTTLLTDSDLGTRPARAVVNATLASVVGDPAVYVSAGWGYHQGPVGGGIVAAIVRD